MKPEETQKTRRRSNKPDSSAGRLAKAIRRDGECCQGESGTAQEISIFEISM